MNKMKSKRDAEWKTHIAEIAEILATGILRLRIRDVCSKLNSAPVSENSLEVPSAKSLHGLEPEQRGNRR